MRLADVIEDFWEVFFKAEEQNHYCDIRNICDKNLNNSKIKQIDSLCLLMSFFESSFHIKF